MRTRGRPGFNEAGVRDAGDRRARRSSWSTRTSFNEAGVRDAGDPVLPSVLVICTFGFNEAGVRDAGDPRATARPRAARGGFNEAGVRDAGDPIFLGTAHALRCSFNEAGVRDAGDLRRGGRGSHAGHCFNEAGVRDAGDPVRPGGEFLHAVGLQRGRRARRRRSVRGAFFVKAEALASTRPACETPEIRKRPHGRKATTLLQRGRRARRRRSFDVSTRPSETICFNEAGVRDAGDLSIAPTSDDYTMTASTRPACETPEIPEHADRNRGGSEASTRPACETPEILVFAPRPACLACASTRPACETPEIARVDRGHHAPRDRLQRGRRARRRRSHAFAPPATHDFALQRGRRARRRRSSRPGSIARIAEYASTRPACETPEILRGTSESKA